MFEFFGRCLNGDIWGFCSRKNGKYIDFGKESHGGKALNGDPSNDPAWDADVDALNEMEYNLVAEQPKGIKLELHDPDNLESPRSTDENKTEKNQKDIPSITVEVDKSADIDNHNELSDLIQEDESEDVKEIDSS